jgi:hypothetical protein
VTAKKRLQMQEGRLQQGIVKLGTQARQAIGVGEDELARTALERKNVAQTEVASLDRQISDLEGQQQKLIDAEQKLRQKVVEVPRFGGQDDHETEGELQYWAARVPRANPVGGRNSGARTAVGQPRGKDAVLVVVPPDAYRGSAGHTLGCCFVPVDDKGRPPVAADGHLDIPRKRRRYEPR